MAQELAQALEQLIQREYGRLGSLHEEQAGVRPREDGWSAKEEIGHLIDSAANNHLRIVRASIDGGYRGDGYAQNAWVQAHGYNELPWATLLHFWQTLNALLVEVVRRVPQDRLGAECIIGDNPPFTLEALIEDYMRHMEHHLGRIAVRRV